MQVVSSPASYTFGEDVVGTLHMLANPAPASVVAFGGSDGGIPDYVAKPIAAEGLTTLALAYFGAPGVAEHLYEIPLEYVERGLQAMAERHGGPVAIIGGSRGGELVLLAASLWRNLISRVVAVVPGSWIYQGVDYSFGPPKPTWTRHGVGLPYLPIAPDAAPPTFSERGMRARPMYEDIWRRRHELAPDAAIAVENIECPVLLVSAGDDGLWNGTEMSRDVVDRMTAAGKAGLVAHLDYPDAGHAFLFSGPDFELPHPPGGLSFDVGGTDASDQEAAADAWPRILSFLST